MADHRNERFGRNAKLEKGLDVLFLLQYNHVSGLTTEDIGKAIHSTDRGTIQRMMESIANTVPGAYIEKIGRRNHLKLQRERTIPVFGDISLDEMADLHAAIELSEANGNERQAGNLKQLEAKIQLAIKQQSDRIKQDLDVLTEVEATVNRPVPSEMVDKNVIANLRRCALSYKQAIIHYSSSKTGEPTPRTVHPYGLLHGHRSYLVAGFDHPDAGRQTRTYKLPGISKVEILEDSLWEEEGFDFRKYAARGFGAYYDKPVNVIWKFSPEAAAKAADFQFHPSQKKNRYEKDGSLIVEFKAGGFVEMAWHALQWGKHLEIIEPEKLRGMVEPLNADWGNVMP